MAKYVQHRIAGANSLAASKMYSEVSRLHYKAIDDAIMEAIKELGMTADEAASQCVIEVTHDGVKTLKLKGTQSAIITIEPPTLRKLGGKFVIEQRVR
jgi:hypothetical protein